MSSGYKALAAAVVRASVEDLEVVYKKVRHWDKLDKQGKLKEYVEEEVEKQASRVAKNYERITITLDESSSVSFFDSNNAARQLYYGCLDLEETPARIQQKKDFVKENARVLSAKIGGYRSHAQRKIKDEAR